MTPGADTTTSAKARTATNDPLPWSCVTLRCGRRLAFTEYGDPQGHPVLLFHGTPGSRLDFAGWDAALRAHALRGIAVDRPGCGGSTAARSRRLTGWPGDIAELAQALHLDRFTVLGASGGGPHALVCAWALPALVDHAVLLCTAQPVGTPGYTDGMAAANRAGMMVARFPLALRAIVRLQRHVVLRAPLRVLRSLRDAVGPEDARHLPVVVTEQLRAEWREAYRHGPEGVAQDALIHARPWGFDVSAVRPRVTLWHGDRDRLAPIAGARHLASRLRDARLHVLDDHGHLLDLYPGTLNRILAATRDHTRPHERDAATVC